MTLEPTFRPAVWRATRHPTIFERERGGLRLRDDRFNEFVESVKPYTSINGPSVPVVNLSGLRYGDPDLIYEALSRCVPPVISWVATSAEEKVLQLSFKLNWLEEMQDPTVFLAEDGVSYLGRIRDNLRVPFRALTDYRLLTYHHLTRHMLYVRPSAKQLGKMMADFHSIGWVAPRGYASQGGLRRLGLTMRDSKSRPQVWESVPALAERIRRQQMREAMQQHLLF